MFEFDFEELWDERLEEELVGAWMYIGRRGLTEYRVARGPDGQLRFDGPDATGGLLSGPLRPEGAWLQAELVAEDAGAVGTIRLRFIEDRRVALSNFRSAGKSAWGQDILAHRASSLPVPGGQGARGEEARPGVAEAPPLPQPRPPISVALHTLTKECSPWVLEAVGALSKEVFGFNMLAALRSGQMELAYLASDSQLVAFVMFALVKDKPQLEVHYIAVEEGYRRQGGARILLEHVRQKCIERQLPQLVAACRWHNVFFYLKLGFYFAHWPPPDIFHPTSRDVAQLHHLRLDVERGFKRPLPGQGSSL